jgi:predicted RNA-binding Zn-ribbon protein involved in translation (DUF1610 family)
MVMKFEKKEAYVCPHCGGEEARMEDYEMDVDCLWTKWYCPECGRDWSEFFTLTYDGYTYDGKVYDADGKECTDI